MAGLTLDMALRRRVGRALNIPIRRVEEGHPIYFTNGTIVSYEGHDLDIIADDSTKAEATKNLLYKLIKAIKLTKK